MDFRIERSQLLSALHMAHGIADRKGTMPILGNVLLRTEGKEQVLCAATDLSVSVLSLMRARVEKEGGVTVASRQLYEIVKAVTAEDIHLRRTEQNWVEVQAGRSEFNVMGMADREYPKLPAVAEAHTSKIDGSVLQGMIAKTLFSVSNDETRSHLSGVFFESDGQMVRMVSTDGHRLSKVGCAMPGSPELASGVIIPRKGVVEIRRALEAHGRNCEIGVYQGQFVVKTEIASLSVKVGDGQFPPYDKVIPKDNERVVTLSREALLDAVRRVAIMASDKTFGVRTTLDKGRLAVEAENPDLGSGHERIDVDYKGLPIAIGFSARYLMELLAEIEAPEVRMEFGEELDPIVVRPADGSDYVGVIMPMRL